MRKRPYKTVTKCRVCGRPSHYKYYGVWSCEGCKQFFRRIVSGGQFYFCAYKGECQISQGKRCRSCRFNKCLEVGMNPILVGVCDENSPIMENLCKYQAELSISQIKLGCKSELHANSPKEYDSIFDNIIPIERAYHRIWQSSSLIPSGYANRHESLENLLEDKETNLMANEFELEDNALWDKAAFLNELEQKGLFSSKILLEIVTKQCFLCIETAKHMPFFQQLDINDQINHIRHICVPFSLLCAAFYSAEISAKTITKNNGFQPICAFLEMKQFLHDEKIGSISTQIFNRFVEKISAAQIDYQQFLWLFMLVLSNSNAEHLSSKSRDLLYAESVRHSKSLLKMLHKKFGTNAGTNKFVRLIELLKSFFTAKYQLARLLIYIEVFYEKRSPPIILLPRVLHQLFA